LLLVVVILSVPFEQQIGVLFPFEYFKATSPETGLIDRAIVSRIQADYSSKSENL
jgi:hypothetical protein